MNRLDFPAQSWEDALPRGRGPPKLISYNQTAGTRAPGQEPRLLHPTEAQDQKPQTILLLSNYRGKKKKKTINKRAFCVAQTWIYTQLWDWLAERVQASGSTLRYFNTVKVEKLRLREVKHFA